MLDLSKFNIDFNIMKETPYFQAEEKHRIRFDLDDLNIYELRDLLGTIFNNAKQINLIFVSEYITNNRRHSAKARVGKYISIRNWKENIILDKSTQEGAVYANVTNIKFDEVIKYCINVRKGCTQAYLAFYNSDFLVYVSTDVIDIIGTDSTKIDKLKSDYSTVYNTFYDK